MSSLSLWCLIWDKGIFILILSLPQAPYCHVVVVVSSFLHGLTSQQVSGLLSDLQPLECHVYCSQSEDIMPNSCLCLVLGVWQVMGWRTAWTMAWRDTLTLENFGHSWGSGSTERWVIGGVLVCDCAWFNAGNTVVTSLRSHSFIGTSVSVSMSLKW